MTDTENRDTFLVSKTEAALVAIGDMHGMDGFAQAAAVEFHALMDGSVTITERASGGDAIARRATTAEAAAATLFCVHHGLSVAVGHVILLGGKLYVTAEGWEAAAENTGLFDGFGDPEAMTPTERDLFAVPDTATACIRIRAYRRGRDRGAVGYGWWDKDKDYEGDKSVPGMTALTRAKRRALRSLFPLSAGTRLPPAERPAHVMSQAAMPAEVAAAQAVVEHVVEVEAESSRTKRPASDAGDRGPLVDPDKPHVLDTSEGMSAANMEDENAVGTDTEDGGAPEVQDESPMPGASDDDSVAGGKEPAEEQSETGAGETVAGGAEEEPARKDPASPSKGDVAAASTPSQEGPPVELDRGKIVAGLQAAWSKHSKEFDAAIHANGIKSAKDVPTADTPTLAKVLAHIEEAVSA